MKIIDWFKPKQPNLEAEENARRIAEQERTINSLRHERDMVRDEVSRVKGELRDVQQRRDAEERDIEHLLKLEREREEVAREKFEAKCEREKHDEIAEVKDDYRNKMEENLRDQITRMERMYGEILTRLPNITAKLK